MGCFDCCSCGKFKADSDCWLRRVAWSLTYSLTRSCVPCTVARWLFLLCSSSPSCSAAASNIYAWAIAAAASFSKCRASKLASSLAFSTLMAIFLSANVTHACAASALALARAAAASTDDLDDHIEPER